MENLNPLKLSSESQRTMQRKFANQVQPHPTSWVKNRTPTIMRSETPVQITQQSGQIKLTNADPASLAYGSHGDREGERRNRERQVQGGGGVVDDVGAEGEEGTVEEVEDRHLAAAVVSAAARPMCLRDRTCQTIGDGAIGLNSDPVPPKYVPEC